MKMSSGDTLWLLHSWSYRACDHLQETCTRSNHLMLAWMEEGPGIPSF